MILKIAKHFFTIAFITLLSFYPSKSCADDSSMVDCLYDSVFIDIKSDYTAEIIFKQEFLFNQAGSVKYSSIRESVNRYVKFSLINVLYIFPDGHTITLKEKDVETVPDFGPGFYYGGKTRIIHLPSTRPGVIARVSYKLKYKSLLYLPQFSRQRDIPTYNSYLEITSELPFEYFVSDDNFNIIKDDSQITIFTDTVPAFTCENYMPPAKAYRVVIRPDTINYEGNKYGFSSWADVAAFYNDLSDDRLIPDVEIVSLAKSLCINAENHTDSLQALFGFVRDNIRYISIDIGRGEFKPLLPEEVLKKRYGDCKDQSALLIAMCRAVGIKANPALITSRDKPDVIIPLPWPGYFNHVITAVDTGAGYFFLDASQLTCCFGHLSPKLRNRRALVCGAESFLDFTLTSPYDPGNRLDFNLVYQINPAGRFRCNVNLKLYKDPAFEFYSKTPDKALKDMLHSFLGISYIGQNPPGFQIDNYVPDFIEITGHFFGELPEIPKSNRLLVNTKSPFFDYLKGYFYKPERVNPYQFDFTFNISEKVVVELSDELVIDKDSLVLTFNERGLNSELSLLSNVSKCEINKSFKLFDYTLSAERYNRFIDFFLIASQIPYNSIEVMPGNIQPEEDFDSPDSF